MKEQYGNRVTAGEEAEIVPNPSDVELLPISPGLAVLQFEIGQNHYVRGNFEQAKAAFAGAMFDDVSNLNYKFWHVAMCLALGDDSLAHDRLYNIMHNQRPEFRNSDAFRSAMRSLERLQGPLRSQLEGFNARSFLRLPSRQAAKPIVRSLAAVVRERVGTTTADGELIPS